MKSKIIEFILYLILAFTPSIADADIKSKIHELDKLFHNVSYSNYYVQLSMLSFDTPIDPPPNVLNFEKNASAIVRINSNFCYVELRKLIDALKDIDLKIYPRDGYPNWMWRISGPPDYNSLTIMVDVNNNLLFIEGRWHIVKTEVIKLVVDQFLTSLNNTITNQRTNQRSY